jgi:hypothetical protein
LFFHHPAVFADTQDPLHKRILAGGQLSLSKSNPENIRTIDASWIKEAVLKHVRIEIYRAVIRGRLDLQDLTIEQEFTLAECVVTDVANFSHATFKRDFFVSDTVFISGIFFQGTTFEHSATFQRTRFEGAPIAFDNAHFVGVFSAEEARFASKGGGTAVFTHVRFDGNADFALAVFNINAHFITTQFGGQGFFPGTRFEGSADFSRAHFFDITTFGGGPPEKYNASFSGQAFFIETQFDSTALFNGVTFESDVSFFSARFGPLAQFVAATFKGFAVFDRIDVAGAAQFGSTRDDARPTSSQPTHFIHEASFSGAHFSSVARFGGIRFDERTDFVAAHFDNDAHFEDSVFEGPTSFRSAAFRAVYFSTGEIEGKPQFGNSVDLLGCTYDRIQVNWRSLLSYPNGQSRIQPYDRQPYIQLEEVFRKAGADSSADDVYADRRRVERASLNAWRKFWDYVYWFIANYGIDLWHELILATVLIGIGTWIFALPGAVAREAGESTTKTKIPWYSAFFLAVHQFLPLALPVKPQWNPSRHVLWGWRILKVTAAFYANLLQIVGWILIPLAAAALTGILRHAAR